jgi:3-phosphoshikimate 1-carboxyvinyltransferase
MGAIGGDIIVHGVNVNSYQGDKEIVSILKKFGASVEFLDNAVRVKKGYLKGITINIESTPDLAQIIAVVGAYSKGQTILNGVSRLKLKESDRIKAIIDSLTTAGIECSFDKDSIKIIGGAPKGSIQSPENDHRAVMSSIALSTFASGVSCVDKLKAIDKSYPSFLGDYKKLGGNFNG